MPAAPSPNCSGKETAHEPDRRNERQTDPTGQRTGAAVRRPRTRCRTNGPARAAGLGCAEPGHGFGIHPGPQTHRTGTPRFDALGRWLLARTAEVAAKREDLAEIAAEPEATVFTNIATGSADVVRPWVDALRNVGFAVFAKPKLDEDSDVDSDMLGHIAQRSQEGLAALMVASADGQAFRAPLEEISPQRGTRPGARISRTRELGASVGYLGVCRPGGHRRSFPGAAAANRPRFAA